MREDKNYSKPELDNHANQLNENNDAYWKARGENERTAGCTDKNVVEMEKKGSGSSPKPANWPAKNGGKSGGNRDNNPPSPPKK